MENNLSPALIELLRKIDEFNASIKTENELDELVEEEAENGI